VRRGISTQSAVMIGDWAGQGRTSDARTKVQSCKDTESGRRRMGQEWAWAQAARTPGEPGASEVRKREGDSCQRSTRDR
jgi:hypothetical protein